MSAPPNRSPLPLQLLKSGKVATVLAFVLGAFLVLLAGFFWMIVRFEVPENHFLVLVNKTGYNLPDDTSYGPDQVVLFPALVEEIAKRDGSTPEEVREQYKGIRYETWGEGRYWKNPWHYKRILGKITNISNDEVGVRIRKYGKPLPLGETVATRPDQRGAVADVLRSGRHNINPFAYDVQKYPHLQIPEGHVGVVTLLHGTEPGDHNTYTVEPNERGVQERTMPPGLAVYNPYVRHVDIVDVRSHRFDMLGSDAIEFPSKDSFEIIIEGTIEWAIRPDKVAEVTVAYGDEEDIVNKVILPNARSLARIQGSRLTAREFMSPARQEFQNALLSNLKADCWEQGIDIKSALVRAITPPAEIANLISKRERADQEIKKYQNQIEEAASEAQLVEQQEMQARQRLIGETNQQVVRLVKDAERRQRIALKDAAREHEVAKLNLEAATKEAAALVARGEAEAQVVLYDYAARAEPLRDAVAAFGGGDIYAQHFFLQKVAPSIKSVLSNTEGPFAEIFQQFQRFGPASTRPTAEAPSNSRNGSLTPIRSRMTQRELQGETSATTGGEPSGATNAPATKTESAPAIGSASAPPDDPAPPLGSASTPAEPQPTSPEEQPSNPTTDEPNGGEG